MTYTEIPQANCYGVIGSRAWPDPASIHRIVANLPPNADLLVGGSKPVADTVIAACCGLHRAFSRYDAGTGHPNTLERDTTLLSDLRVRKGVLVAFLAGEPKRSHVVADEAEEAGIVVCRVQPPPTDEPAVAAVWAKRLARFNEAVDQAAAARHERRWLNQGSNTMRADQLRATVDRLAHDIAIDVAEMEAQLLAEERWLQAHPLALDFAVREQRTLVRLVTLTAALHALNRYQDAFAPADATVAV